MDIEPGQTREYHIRVSLKPTAGNAPLTGFFGVIRSRTVEIDPLLSTLQAWRKTNFGDYHGTGNRANDADFDSDGVPNLEEYVNGTDPKVNETTLNTNNGLYAFKPVTNQAPFKFRLAMHPDAMNDTKVRVTVQMSTGLTGWATLTSRTGGGSWSSLQPDFTVPQNGVTNFLFSTTYTPTNTKKFFIRLRAEELP